MLFTLKLLPFGISELFAQVSKTRLLTEADRYGLMAAIMDDTITEEERQAIDRLLYAIYRGRLQMVNEISAVM